MKVNYLYPDFQLYLRSALHIRCHIDIQNKPFCDSVTCNTVWCTFCQTVIMGFHNLTDSIHGLLLTYYGLCHVFIPCTLYICQEQITSNHNIHIVFFHAYPCNLVIHYYNPTLLCCNFSVYHIIQTTGSSGLSVALYLRVQQLLQTSIRVQQ